MAWYPGKNIMNGWYPGKNIVRGIKRNRELKQRGMDVPMPEYDQAVMDQFGAAAASGGGMLAGARGAQNHSLQAYQQQALGKGPSVAQAQLAQQNQQNVANQMAMASQARGGNIAAQGRQAAAAGAAGAMGTQQQMSQLAAQEQQAGMQGAAGMANEMAGQGLQQQLGAMGLQGQAAGQQLAGQTQWGLGQRGLDLEQLGGSRGFGTGIANSVAGLIQGIGGAAALSDKDEKKGIKKADDEIGEAFAAMSPQTWQYKAGPGPRPPGRHIGVMAQDMERSQAGKRAVIDTTAGKMVDQREALGMALAHSAAMEKRVRALEGKK